MITGKLAVISDIHGNRPALEAVLKDIERRGIQNIVNLGDCFYGPLDPAGTAQILIPLDIPTVMGNEDRIIIEPPGELENSPTLCYARERLRPEHLEWLKSLPMTAVVSRDIFLCHGSPARDDEYLSVDVSARGVFLRNPGELAAMLFAHEQEVFLCGHDHVPRSLYLPGKKQIVDPGSVGLPAYSDDRPFPHVMETGTPHARYSIIYQDEKDWRIEDIAVPYDWDRAAGIAAKNNRPDWAKWLKTGRARAGNQVRVRTAPPRVFPI